MESLLLNDLEPNMDDDNLHRPKLQSPLNPPFPLESTNPCYGIHESHHVKTNTQDQPWNSNEFQLFGNYPRDIINETTEPVNNEQINGAMNITPNVPVKLFVNRIPKWICNEKLKSIFSTYGKVMECNILKDHDGHKGCAFIKFASIHDAHLAIQNIHSKVTLNQEAGPVQIKYADGEIERLGLSPDCQPGGEAVKVFVGCLPKSTTKEDLFNLFSRYGRVDEVYVIRDNNKQPKCSAFVTFPRMSMAITAIKALDKNYYLPTARRAIEVRLAEGKGSKNKTFKQTEETSTTNFKKSIPTKPPLSHPGHIKGIISNDSKLTDSLGDRHSSELSTTYEQNDEYLLSRSSACSQFDNGQYSFLNFPNKSQVAQFHDSANPIIGFHYASNLIHHLSIENSKKSSNIPIENLCCVAPCSSLKPDMNEQLDPNASCAGYSYIVNDSIKFGNDYYMKRPQKYLIHPHFNNQPHLNCLQFDKERCPKELSTTQNFFNPIYSTEQFNSYNYPLYENKPQDPLSNIMRCHEIFSNRNMTNNHPMIYPTNNYNILDIESFRSDLNEI